MGVKYFKAAGRSLEIVQAFHADQLSRDKAIGEFVEAHGNIAPYVIYDKVSGLLPNEAQWEQGPPPGWKAVKENITERKYFTPAPRLPGGKEVLRAMQALPHILTARDLAIKFGIAEKYEHLPHGAFQIAYNKIKEHWVIMEPDALDFFPPDAVPMDAVEYWALRARPDSRDALDALITYARDRAAQAGNTKLAVSLGNAMYLDTQ